MSENLESKKHELDFQKYFETSEVVSSTYYHSIDEEDQGCSLRNTAVFPMYSLVFLSISLYSE